jgi:hypothetical protein
MALPAAAPAPSEAELPTGWSKLTSFIRGRFRLGPTNLTESNMAKWVLICESCRTEFQQSQVSYSEMDSYNVPLKPKLPSNTCTCLSCGHTAAYRRTDWVYRTE